MQEKRLRPLHAVHEIRNFLSNPSDYSCSISQCFYQLIIRQLFYLANKKESTGFTLSWICGCVGWGLWGCSSGFLLRAITSFLRLQSPASEKTLLAIELCQWVRIYHMLLYPFTLLLLFSFKHLGTVNLCSQPKEIFTDLSTSFIFHYARNLLVASG